MDKAVKGCDKVYHLAAVYAFWMKNPQLMFDVNVTGSKNVLDACVDQGVKKIVYTSSVVRYGGQGLDKQSNENSPFVMGSTGELYSISKYQSQELAEQYARDGLNLCIVNPTLPIGPGDIGPTPTGRYLIGMIKNPVVVYTDSVTNAGDVRDIAAGHILAMDKGEKGRSYILGGLEDVSMKAFIELSFRILNKKKPVLKISGRAFEAIGYLMEMYAEFVSGEAPVVTSQAARASAMGLRADCSRAQKELGYTCRPLEDSIRDAIAWFREHQYI
jgi:dihydroflavonol-4-reductase